MNSIKKKLKSYIRDKNQIFCITCYDASFGKILNDLRIDIVLVGDSLGMVIKGDTTTHNVTIDEMIYHSSCVAKTKQNFIMMADMPINSYEDSDIAYLNSRKLLDNNVDIIKLEYQDKHQSIIKKLVEENIPVCGHIGLLPQIAFEKKDLRIYGREAEERDKLIRQAKDLEELGVDIVLLECVHAEVTKEITDSINIPVIGIGSGESCNGQVQVLYDILGISNNPPKFSKNYLKDADSVSNAIKNFSNYVKKIKY